MAVLIQQQINVEYSGVVFTESPYCNTQLIIEYVAGLGTPVVAGIGPIQSMRIDRKSLDDLTVSLPFSLEALVRVALELERHFACSQDVEWGSGPDGITIFQSRDIVPARPIDMSRPSKINTPLTAMRLTRISDGFAVGRVVNTSSNGRGWTKIVVRSDANALSFSQVPLSHVGGVISTTGGILAHFASVLRENNIPAGLLSPAEAATFANDTVVLDCREQVMYRLKNLNNEERKEAVFRWALYMAHKGVPGFTENKKVEGVITEIPEIRKIWKFVARVGNAQEFIQSIYPFDFEERIYTGISARVQCEPGLVRVQIASVTPVRTEGIRQEQEIVIHTRSLEDALTLLRDLGYGQRPMQERLLCRVTALGATFTFNNWPNSHYVYIGVEARNSGELAKALLAIGVSRDAVEALNGIDIFRKYGLSLENCVFQEQAPSMASLIANLT